MLLSSPRKAAGPSAELLTANGVDSAAVSAQLERVLSSELFQHSKRYPKFLRYVVEQTLKGESAHLKERTLGVAVFSRSPEYDTSADPVVRNTASEVRKRIDEYYGELVHNQELRITLPVGSYIPEFRFPDTHDLQVTEESERQLEAQQKTQRAALLTRRWTLAVVAVGLFLTAALGLFWPKPAIDRFWAPVLRSSNSVLVVIGPVVGLPEVQQPSNVEATVVSNRLDPKLYLLLTDLHARMGSFLQAHGKKFDFELADDTKIARLRRAPFVLMGAFNNSWTLRATKSFRYYPELDREHRVREIVDRENPLRRDWRVPMSPGIAEDYALIARAVDSVTGQWMMVVAGMGEKGGAAATEFVTEPNYLERLARLAPRDWDRRNIEVVIQTKLVDGDWAAPRVVASHFW
jgi:hypothetical protein